LPLKGIVPTISTPLYQTGNELEVLCFHPINMHTPPVKIEEDIEFAKVLNVKKFLKTPRELIT
jgi:hypothetical protein